MLKGVGCDLVETVRIERSLQNPRFSEKVYTPAECTYLAARTPETAAGLWAAKEAVSKALGTGFAGFSMRDIEICHEQSGRPYVRLYGRADELYRKLGGKQIFLSISHDGGCALAFAVLA